MNADRAAGASQQAVIPAVRHEVVVSAPIERAFRVFTDGFGLWWPRNHTIASFPVERAIIEPWAGGRCYDRGADGSECDWGQVLVWEPPAKLVLAWQVDGAWSYEAEVDNASRVTVSFTALGGQTRVNLVHDEFERHLNAGPELAEGVRDGWGSALRQYSDAVGAHPVPEPGFVFMVFHYPEAGRAEALAAGMREMGAHLAGQPGLIGVDPPWWDEQRQALVGISRWESEAAFRAVLEVGPDSAVPEGEREPRQRFFFTTAG